MKFRYQHAWLMGILLAVLTFSTQPLVWGITDAEIISGLEAMGEWETAYPLAYQQAQTQETYQAWRDVAIKYAKFDKHDQAYLKAWQQAYTLNQEEIYRDFLTIKPDSPLRAQAINALFKVIQAANDMEKYQKFMEEFPDVVESIEALLKLQELAFERATQAHDPLVFDAFVTTFPGAKQIPQAIDLAFQAAQQAIEKYKDNHDQHENMARRLFNEARVAEKENNTLLSSRHYRLLSLDIFRDTKVFTEMLDREERFAYQKLMEAHQTATIKSIQEMHKAVVETVQVQTQHLEKTVQVQTQHLEKTVQVQMQHLEKTVQVQMQHLEKTVKTELKIHSQRLEAAIASHNQALSEQLEQLNQRINNFGKQDIIGDISDLVAAFVPAVKQGIAIARFIKRVLPTIINAFSSPTLQQAILFAKTF